MLSSMHLAYQNNLRSCTESIIDLRYGAGKIRDIHSFEIFHSLGTFCFGDFLITIGASKYVDSLLLVHEHTLYHSLVCLIHKRPVILVS